MSTWTCKSCNLPTSADHAPKDCISALRHRLIEVNQERDRLVETIQELKKRPTASTQT